MKDAIQKLWPDAKVEISGGWCNTITLTSTYMLNVSFGQLMKVAAILDTDKFEIDKNTEHRTWQISEVTWDGDSVYGIKIHWKDENVGEWSKPEMKAFANEFEYKRI